MSAEPRRAYGPLDRRGAKVPTLGDFCKRKDLYEDPLQHLWAVSYSDLLMVLMSFFILFFSMSDSDTEKNILKNVLIAVQNKLPTVTLPHSAAQGASQSATRAPAETGPGQGTAAAGTARRPGEVLAELAAVFQDGRFGFNKTNQSNAIILDLPDNFYGPGQYALPQKGVQPLKSALSAIKPYRANLELIFVGHTDATPLSQAHKKILDSNLVLSNLRATRAVEFALNEGFDPKHVVAEGSGEHSRNTRSLSLRITERRAQ
jgi:flagellar motor protein MotB